MEVVVGLALGVGALYFAKKKGRKVVRSAVGWTARKSGWIASRVRASLDDARTVAREQYERGRADATSEARRKASNGNGPPRPSAEV